MSKSKSNSGIRRKRHRRNAVPDEGFAFVKWSGGSINAIRADANITTAFSATAEFERIEKTFSYIYNNATANNTQTNVLLHRRQLKDVRFVMPQKEHFFFDGWYFEADFKTQVTDGLCNFIIGDEILDSNSSELYAKWKVKEEITYTILMIFVDEIHATLETSDGGSFEVKYKMSALEKKLCEIITLQVSTYLNKMFDGLIAFQVDSYFTKTALGEENLDKTINSYTDGTRMISYTVPTKNISEVSGMIDEYKCTMTTFSFYDYKDILHYAAGYGNEGDVMIHFKNLVLQTLYNGDTIEDLFNLEYRE